MQRTSQIAVTYAIDFLIQQLWKGVANSIISHKLALKAAQLQSIEFLTSYMSNATQNKQIQRGMKCQSDPTTIQIDTMAYGQLPKEQKKNKQTIAASRKGSVNQSINQTRSRRFTIESFNKQKSPQSKNVSFSDAPGLITLPEIEDPHYVTDVKQDECRNRVFRNQKQDSDMKKMLSQRNKQREQNSVKNKKILKQLKKYTYDYDGKFFSVGALQSRHQKAIKLQNQNGEQSISSKQIKVPQQKNIGNQKLKERETRNNRQFSKGDKNMPEFNENRPQSLLDMFEDADNNISEGVKLVGEKGKQKIIKQKPRRKLSGMKKYRLNQYQGIVKDNRFKDYKIPHSKHASATIDVNKTAPLNSYNPQSKNLDSSSLKPNLNSNSQISLTLKKQDPVSILPPIQSTFLKNANKLGFKRLSVGYQQSQKSLLNQSGGQSRRSRKSQIKVDHQQLYFQNFSLNTYGK